MRQKDSYFGSIFERSKTPVLPRPVNNYILPPLHDERNWEVNESLESFETEATNIEKSPDNLVPSSHNGLFPARNIAIQESASSLETAQYKSKTEKSNFRTIKEISETDIRKSNNKDTSIELLDEDNSSTTVLGFRGNTRDIRDFISIPSSSLENMRDKSGLEDKRVKGNKEESSSANLLSSYAAYLSERELDVLPQLNVLKVNQNVSSSETIPHSLRTEKPLLETVNEDIAVKSNNIDGSTTPFKEEGNRILVRPKENIPDMKSSISVPALPRGNVTGKEPSLIIKKIDIQIVDNRRPNPARTKKIDHAENDVLSRNYLWRFNIS